MYPLFFSLFIPLACVYNKIIVKAKQAALVLLRAALKSMKHLRDLLFLKVFTLSHFLSIVFLQLRVEFHLRFQ